MDLILQRFKPKSPGYPVLGNLTGGGLDFWTLEDPYIFRPAGPVASLPDNQTLFPWPFTTVKIPGVTAIQAKRYRMYLTQSPRFGRLLPLVVDVPGFTGIRFHRGNSAENSAGCILVGDAVDPSKKFLLESKAAEEAMVIAMQQASGEEIWLTISNPTT